MARWLTDEERQVCVGYNDNLLGPSGAHRPLGGRKSDLYHLGAALAAHDNGNGVCSTGRERAIEAIAAGWRTREDFHKEQQALAILQTCSENELAAADKHGAVMLGG